MRFKFIYIIFCMEIWYMKGLEMLFVQNIINYYYYYLKIPNSALYHHIEILIKKL